MIHKRALISSEVSANGLCGAYRNNRVSPLEFLGILDLVSDRAGQAVRRFLSVTVDPAILQIELVLRNVLHAVAVAAAVVQDRLPPALIGIVLRARANAPVMLEDGIIVSHDLIADRHSSLRQFLAGLIRPAAHLDLHFPRLSISESSRTRRVSVGRPSQDPEKSWASSFICSIPSIFNSLKCEMQTARAQMPIERSIGLSPARLGDESRESSSKLSRQSRHTCRYGFTRAIDRDRERP